MSGREWSGLKWSLIQNAIQIIQWIWSMHKSKYNLCKVCRLLAIEFIVLHTSSGGGGALHFDPAYAAKSKDFPTLPETLIFNPYTFSPFDSFYRVAIFPHTRTKLRHTFAYRLVSFRKTNSNKNICLIGNIMNKLSFDISLVWIVTESHRTVSLNVCCVSIEGTIKCELISMIRHIIRMWIDILTIVRHQLRSFQSAATFWSSHLWRSFSIIDGNRVKNALKLTVTCWTFSSFSQLNRDKQREWIFFEDWNESTT